MSRTHKPRGYRRHSYRSSKRGALKYFRIRGNRDVRRRSSRVLYDVQRGRLDYDGAIFPMYPQERFDWWFYD